jgi:hypothetical protein
MRVQQSGRGEVVEPIVFIAPISYSQNMDDMIKAHLYPKHNLNLIDSTTDAHPQNYGEGMFGNLLNPIYTLI